ncbi:MAG TPA: dethiobiotin synthase [Chthoniobacterales bacterium]|nr:dethiobiotin synthase [Chthoniobacterales bacterium]
MNYLVTGTDTGVGKTFVTSGLVRSSRSKGIDAVGMKAIRTGDNLDVQKLREACDSCEPEFVLNPVWLRTPVAPYTASLIEDRQIDLDALRNAFAHLAQRHAHVLVEGAGGIAVPIRADFDFRDLARDLQLEVVVVAANRLGVLNHVRLTEESIRTAGLRCRAIVLNTVQPDSDISQPTNHSVLESLIDVPVLSVEHGQTEFSALAGLLGWYAKRPRFAPEVE